MPDGMDDDGAPDLCLRCAAQGKTCCQRTSVFVTLGDVDRIAAQTKQRDFHEYIAVGPDDRPDGDALWAAAAGKNRVRVLRHKNSGDGKDCLFLGPAGCELALETRPLICRLYPFEYDHATLRGVTPRLCPPPERDNHPLLLALLAMNRDQAEKWRRMLYDEIAREQHA